MSDGGKGDKRRPQQVSDKEFVERWKKIFNKASAKHENVEDILKEMVKLNQKTEQYDD